MYYLCNYQVVIFKRGRRLDINIVSVKETLLLSRVQPLPETEAAVYFVKALQGVSELSMIWGRLRDTYSRRNDTLE
jgi:hypothetical protein